jgi:general secretion pathway protein K
MKIARHFREGSLTGGRTGDVGGSTLVITLLIIATLTGLTLAFSEESSTELELAGFAADGYRAYQLARSGIHLALWRLAQDEDRNMDSLREDWSRLGVRQFPEDLPEEPVISGAIVDENSKININGLLDQSAEINPYTLGQVIRLFKTLGLEEDLVYPLVDWLDSDDEESLYGAESFYYQSLKEPYECANGPLATIAQLSLIKGLGAKGGLGETGDKKLRDFFTIYSDGKINVNTAPKEVLLSLHEDMDASLAQSIVEYREEEDFVAVDDLKKVPGMDERRFEDIRERITVKSSAFSMEVTVVVHEAVADVRAVATMQEGSPVLVYWQVM